MLIHRIGQEYWSSIYLKEKGEKHLLNVPGVESMIFLFRVTFATDVMSPPLLYNWKTGLPPPLSSGLCLHFGDILSDHTSSIRNSVISGMGNSVAALYSPRLYHTSISPLSIRTSMMVCPRKSSDSRLKCCFTRDLMSSSSSQTLTLILSVALWHSLEYRGQHSRH